MAEAIALPTRTTLEDVTALVKYLATKPMGATASEAKSIIDTGVLDGRKLSAYKFWGLVEDAGSRLKLKERGRLAAKDKGAHLPEAMLEIIHSVPAYAAVVERAIHKKEHVVTAIEVATHWHEHFGDVASSNETILNHQAFCYFQIVAGAGLGNIIVGRKGAPTRLEFSEEGLAKFENGATFILPDTKDEEDEADDIGSSKTDALAPAALVTAAVTNNKVFITHGQNKKVLDQIKDILVVEDGLTLPSNLQGLYECRYTGDELSSAATMGQGESTAPTLPGEVCAAARPR
jgi:hypothetical protein